MVKYFLSPLIMLVILIPIWMKMVYRAEWALIAKNITIGVMLLISTAFTLWMVFKPDTQSLASKFIGSGITIIYYLIVIATVFYLYRKSP